MKAAADWRKRIDAGQGGMAYEEVGESPRRLNSGAVLWREVSVPRKPSNSLQSPVHVICIISLLTSPSL